MLMHTIKIVSQKGIELMDLMTHSFLKDRGIYIFEPITNEMACIVIAQ